MNRRAILQRVYLAVLATLIMSFLSVWGIFSIMSGDMFLKLRMADIETRAQALSTVAGRYLRGEIDESPILRMANENEYGSSVIGAYLIITDEKGNKLIETDDTAFNDPSIFDRYIKTELSGISVFTVLHPSRSAHIVLAGVPILSEGKVIGTLTLYLPEISSMVARRTLTGALTFAMLIMIPIVSMLIFLMLYRIVHPLRQMRDVALSMAGGKFTQHANEKAPGEIGQLGMSLNTLSRELDRSIRELTLERNRLVLMLNSLTEGIAAVDKNGVIVRINPALGALFGNNETQPDARLRLIPHENVWELFDSALAGGGGGNITITHGEKQILCIIVPVYDEAGVNAGALGTFRDISNEERLEQTRREYVANVSHEMRTPLTALRGLIEPLRDGLVKDDATRQRYYDIMLSETLRLSRLISDIMELSRLQSGSQAIECEPFMPGEIVIDLAERYTPIANDNGLELTLDPGFDTLPYVYSNRDRVEQLLVILLDNAIKYTKEGSIALSWELKSDHVLMKVRDTGVGISEDNLEHIFDRFYKVDKAHSGNGSGLGLSIAREVLNAMGEQLFVASRVGEGSEFSFTLKRFNGTEEA